MIKRPKIIFFTAIPIGILISMLLFINYTVGYFKDISYSYIYQSATRSVQRFADERTRLVAEGYTGPESTKLFTNMVHSFSKILGEEDATVTFLVDENMDLHYSTENNKEYLSYMLNNDDNLKLIFSEIKVNTHGEIKLKNKTHTETLFYQKVDAGNIYFYFFICIDRKQVNVVLNADKIIIPLCIIALIFLFSVKYILWLKIFDRHTIDKKEGSNADRLH